MSIDKLQEKIRKTKNPTMMDLSLSPWDIPQMVRSQFESAAAAYGAYCEMLLKQMKGWIPGIRVGLFFICAVGRGRKSAAEPYLEVCLRLWVLCPFGCTGDLVR